MRSSSPRIDILYCELVMKMHDREREHYLITSIVLQTVQLNSYMVNVTRGNIDRKNIDKLLTMTEI